MLLDLLEYLVLDALYDGLDLQGLTVQLLILAVPLLTLQQGCFLHGDDGTFEGGGGG